MDRELFFVEFKRLMDYLGVFQTTTNQAISLYYDQLKVIPIDIFKKTIDNLIKTWQYKHLPLIADILNVYKSVKPTESNYRPEPRDDKAFNPMVQIKEIRLGLRCQDLIKKQLLKPVYGEDYDSGHKATEKRDALKSFMNEKVRSSECFSLQSERWGKKENAVITGNYYFFPENFGW